MDIAVVSTIFNAKEARIAPRAVQTWRRALDRSGHNGWIWIYSQEPTQIDHATFKLLYEEVLFSDNFVKNRVDMLNKYVAERKTDLLIFTRPDIFFVAPEVHALIEEIYEGLYQFFALPPGACAISREVARSIFPIDPDDNIVAAIAREANAQHLAWRCLPNFAKEGR